MSFSVDEVRFLTRNLDAISEAASLLDGTRASAFSDHRILAERFGENARAVAELIDARSRATAKFPSRLAGRDVDTWLFDSDSAQQATPHAVAQVRAQHLRDAGVEFVHDVTCSVGSETPAMLDAGMQWLGSDLDHARLLMAKHNLANACGRAWLARADALRPFVGASASASAEGYSHAVVADPARRGDGRRITDPAKLIPPLPDLLAAHAGTELAVKCAPGIDYSDWDGLVSVVSLDGGVKEAGLYTPGLSDLKREAVVLRGAGLERVTDADEGEVDVDKHGSFIVEPDGAVIRAGLVRQWAARHGLWMLDPRIAFLTGEAIPAGWSGFRVLDRVPLKKLRAAMAAHHAGAVEILVRGVDVDPDVLRKKLKLKGDRPMAVIIAREGDAAVAYVCNTRETA